MTLLKHELKENWKSFLIWTISIVVICFGCLLMYGSLEESLDEMAQMYANMGNFSAAFGMDRINIGTMEGFYATEIAIMFGLGAAMYAAMLGSAILSKEEEGHTVEFLFTLPQSRKKVVLVKYAAMFLLVLLLNLIVVAFSLLGFACMGNEVNLQGFWLYHGICFLMEMEIATICFLISAVTTKKNVGIGIGLVILLYAGDMMCRLIPDLEDLKYVIPYYYANAVDLFQDGLDGKGPMLATAAAMIVLCFAASLIIYDRKDLKA